MYKPAYWRIEYLAFIFDENSVLLPARYMLTMHILDESGACYICATLASSCSLVPRLPARDGSLHTASLRLFVEPGKSRFEGEVKGIA